MLFRLAKLRSKAVSDESVWLEVEGEDGLCHWTLSSDPEDVKVFAAHHFRGLQAEHDEWNRDPASWPLYHDGPRKGQPRCPLKLQAIFDWLGTDCPDEAIYSSLSRRMDMAVFKRILACLKTQSAAGPSGLSYVVLLSSTKEFLTMCLSFINLFLRSGSLGPLQWLRSDITAILKSSVRSGKASTRHVPLV